MKHAALDVYSGARAVGRLARSALHGGEYLFDYDRNIDPIDVINARDAVSLTMPVVANQYDAMNTVHPVFEMSLPEGALRERLIRTFGKTIAQFDDLDLLGIVGGSQIGRLRFTMPGEPLRTVPTQSVKALLAHRGAEDFLEDLLDRFASASGISGMQPKVLVRDADVVARLTHRDTTHIVKAFDSRRYPELAANEYFCLRAAAGCGLPVPPVQLSKNRRLLVIERFDLGSAGTYLGFEDFCVLNALRSLGRYDASYEIIARRIAQFVTPSQVSRALTQFFSMVALVCATGNGDAHLKNFGLLYADPESDVTLAPAFDLVCTRAYLPRDTLALSLQGSKAFPDRAAVLAFGQTACSLAPRQARALLDQALAAVTNVRRPIQRFAKAHRAFAPVGNAMLKVFDEQRQLLAARLGK